MSNIYKANLPDIEFLLDHCELLDQGGQKGVGESVFKNSPIHTHSRLYHSNSCDVFMSFSSWPVARSHILVILIGLSNTQIFDHDLVREVVISAAALVNLLDYSHHLHFSFCFDDISKTFCAILDTSLILQSKFSYLNWDFTNKGWFLCWP